MMLVASEFRVLMIIEILREVGGADGRLIGRISRTYLALTNQTVREYGGGGGFQ